MATQKLMPTKSLKAKKNSAMQARIPFESFLLIFIASFAIGFVVSLISWLLTVDYIFVVLK